MERPSTQPVVGGPASSFVLRAPSRVGTHAGNELVLSDPTVSRVHAELTPTAEGVRGRDLSSRNGTLVNGVPVFDALAAAGTRITLGRVSLTGVALVDEQSPVAPAPLGPMLGIAATHTRMDFKRLFRRYDLDRR